MTTRNVPAAVYRLYDTGGALLYVGMSSSPRSRLKDHVRKKPWAHRIARKTFEWYPTRTIAFLVEAEAIETEQPEFNPPRKPRRKPDSSETTGERQR